MIRGPGLIDRRMAAGIRALGRFETATAAPGIKAPVRGQAQSRRASAGAPESPGFHSKHTGPRSLRQPPYCRVVSYLRCSVANFHCVAREMNLR